MKKTTRWLSGAGVVLCLLVLAFSACSSTGEPQADGDLAPDGDELPDADAPPDGDASPDGDEPPEGDAPPDGDQEESADGDEEPVPLRAYDCILDTDCRDLMVVAHRGHHATHPENTLAALRDAVAIGSHMVEVDVRHTADDALVIVHDPTVDRVANGTGEVSQMTLETVRGLTLKECEAENAESCMIPLFSETLALARELGIMLYVDAKTGRMDLLLETIQEQDYYDVALVRADFSDLHPTVTADPQVLIMPPVGDLEELDAILGVYPALRIVELSSVSAMPALTAELLGRGVKVQQDIMGGGDLQADLFGDYRGWKTFVDAGVTLLQTNLPHLLTPLAEYYNARGVFPENADDLAD